MLLRTLVKKRQVATVALVTTAVVVSSLFFLILPSLASSPSPPSLILPHSTATTQQSSSSKLAPRLASWAFLGAYANYSGSSKLPDGTAYNLTYGWKVLEMSGTKARVISQMTIQYRSDPQPTVYRHNHWYDTAWSSKARPFAMFTNDTLLFNYNSTVTMSGKTIPVTVYHVDTEGSSLTVTMNREVGLPILFTITMALGGNTWSITGKLANTNVPGLTP